MTSVNWDDPIHAVLKHYLLSLSPEELWGRMREAWLRKGCPEVIRCLELGLAFDRSRTEKSASVTPEVPVTCENDNGRIQATLPVRPCEFCKEPFTPPTKWTRFCCESHQVMARRKRKADTLLALVAGR